MSDHLVDARGQLCPKPLILTKKALAAAGVDDSLTILIDNPTSFENVSRFLKDNKISSVHSLKDGLFTLSATKGSAVLTNPNTQSYCTPTPAPQSGGQVICIKSQLMGDGPEELGAILMRAFVNTIREITPLPDTIVFYNTGILLTLEGSPLVEPLRELQARGVDILVCGTCADYFQKKDRVQAGTISNMYTILETLTNAHHVLYP